MYISVFVFVSACVFVYTVPQNKCNISICSLNLSHLNLKPVSSIWNFDSKQYTKSKILQIYAANCYYMFWGTLYVYLYTDSYKCAHFFRALFVSACVFELQII